MTLDPEAAARRTFDRLCAEAIWSEGRALWLGDDKRELNGVWEVVHASTDGSLYGGTAGIGLVLARAWRATGAEPYRSTALGALEHAAAWCERQRPAASLYTGRLGVATALAEGAVLLGDADLRGRAVDAAADAAAAPPLVSFDLLAGAAGAIVGWLRLADVLADPSFVAHASASARRLMAMAAPASVGVAWADAGDETQPPLCGLAHGASGAAWALAEVARRTGAAEPAAVAEQAMAYERSWYRRPELNWPDLRELDRTALAGATLGDSPVFWCHGALGIGLSRLRVFELTGSTVALAEAEAALLAAERQIAWAATGSASPDACLCHGLAGAIELLLEGARILDQPELTRRAEEGAEVAIALAGGGDGPWPCGVAGGGENPSLMLGLAGIAGTLLRVARPQTPSLGLLYAEPIASTRLIVKFSGPIEPNELQTRIDELTQRLAGARVEHVSRTGRVLVRLGDGSGDASMEDAAAAARAVPGVEYAEPDVVDRATDSG